MTLLINNEDVQQVLTMEATMAALDQAYSDYAAGEAVCRPRIDIRIPTSDPAKFYQFGTMEGGSTRGYFGIRMKSDVIWQDQYGGTQTQEKYSVRPGLFCGLIWLFSVENAEPLAIINDGYLQHMRVGADSGIGARYMAREDSEVLGMIGSGGMARSHVEAFLKARPIKRVQAFSPTKEHREEYAAEIRAKFEIDAVAVDTPEEAHRGADIVAGCTDATVPVVFGRHLDPGTHVTCVGGRMDEDAYSRIDVSLRLGSAPAPLGREDLELHDESIAFGARPEYFQRETQRGGRSHGVVLEDRAVFLKDLLDGSKQGRTSDDQITYSARGNIQGLQFFAVAGVAYQACRTAGLGRELPTEWFLQDIRD